MPEIKITRTPDGDDRKSHAAMIDQISILIILMVALIGLIGSIGRLLTIHFEDIVRWLRL